jgi:hypothetical protein
MLGFPVSIKIVAQEQFNSPPAAGSAGGKHTLASRRIQIWPPIGPALIGI